jgi:hypothetical protein
VGIRGEGTVAREGEGKVPFSSFLTSSLIFSRSSGSVGSPLDDGMVGGLLVIRF